MLSWRDWSCLSLSSTEDLGGGNLELLGGAVGIGRRWWSVNQEQVVRWRRRCECQSIERTRHLLQPQRLPQALVVLDA